MTDWASRRAKELIQEFQLKGHIGNNWHFQWNRGLRFLGRCNYCKGTIELSYHYAQHGSLADIEDTIRHEIAHAMAGPMAKHGPFWKSACLVTGAKPLACFSDKNPIPAKYISNCAVCNKEYRCYRKLKNMNSRICNGEKCKQVKPYAFLKWITVTDDRKHQYSR